VSQNSLFRDLGPFPKLVGGMDLGPFPELVGGMYIRYKNPEKLRRWPRK